MLCSTQLLDDTDQLEDGEPVQVIFILMGDQGVCDQNSDFLLSSILRIRFCPTPLCSFLSPPSMNSLYTQGALAELAYPFPASFFH